MKKLQNREKPATITLRLPLSLHNALKKQAAKEGMTLNQYSLYLLSRSISQIWKEE